MQLIITLINVIVEIIILIIFVHVILSFFMSPFHPIRQTIDRIVSPMLEPIRRFMPQTGMVDFSPMVLILILYLARSLLIGFLR